MARTDTRLLKNICYISRPAIKDTTLTGDDIIVHPTFPYNPESKTSPQTAKNWATFSYYNRRLEESHDPEPITLSNDPFTVKIISLEHRGEGGRAYKVIDDQMRLFDLREDQLVEAISLSGINTGGVIGGTFVWGVLGSSIRLAHVGGKLHKEMIEGFELLSTEEKKKIDGTSITGSKLVEGLIYMKRNGDRFIFLGRCTIDDSDTLYAFIDCPERPDRNNCDLTGCSPDHIERVMRTNEVHDQWESMSWTSRFNWIECRSYYRSDCSYHHPITLMKTPPKFTSYVDDNGIEIISSIRDNTELIRKYNNGYGEDLSELRWSKNFNGGERRTIPNSSSNWSRRPHTDSDLKTYESSIRTSLTDFRDSLVWRK